MSDRTAGTDNGLPADVQKQVDGLGTGVRRRRLASVREMVGSDCQLLGEASPGAGSQLFQLAMCDGERLARVMFQRPCLNAWPQSAVFVDGHASSKRSTCCLSRRLVHNRAPHRKISPLRQSVTPTPQSTPFVDPLVLVKIFGHLFVHSPPFRTRHRRECATRPDTGKVDLSQCRPRQTARKAFSIECHLSDLLLAELHLPRPLFSRFPSEGSSTVT